MTKDEYYEYLRSPYWQRVRAAVLSRASGTCEGYRCFGESTHMHVHHWSYDHLGSELLHLNDVALLCDDCHKREHGLSPALPDEDHGLDEEPDDEEPDDEDPADDEYSMGHLNEAIFDGCPYDPDDPSGDFD